MLSRTLGISRGWRTGFGVRFRSTVDVVFLRHAQSTWNKENLFMGWTDTPLTKVDHVLTSLFFIM